MLKKLVLALVALIVIAVIVVAMQPADYRLERSIKINAPADIVWAQVADFSQWKNWSHWEKSDPSQKTTITGAPGTAGHKTVWQGDKTGEGTMTVAAATKPSALHIELAFTAPMASEATTDMKIEGEGEAVTVTWSMAGKNDFMGKFFGLVMGMEDMIGQAYETSLANLKQVAEDNAKVAKAKADAAAAAAVESNAPAAAPAVPTP